MTQSEKILVLGASGKTGSATAYNLLAVGIPVRAFVHRLDERSKALEQAGAEIFLGSVSDFDSISAALKGIKKAYFVAPWTPEQLHFSMTFAVAAAQSELNLIVCITQWLGQPQHPSVATRQSYLTDQIFDMIPNVDVVKINTGWFADNYMQPELLAMMSQLGLFAFPLGNGLAAPISNEDLGRVIAAALLNPAPYAGKTLRPTGPKMMSPIEIAQIFSKVMGRSVKYDDISEKLFLKALGAMGMHPHMQAQLKHYVRDYRQGAFAGVTTVVKDMTGQEPESFETTVRRYVSRNEITERKFANKVKALGGFLSLLLTKPADLVHFEKASGYPAVKGPKLGLDHAPWVDSHPIKENYG